MTVRETAATGFSSFPHSCQPGCRRALTWMIAEFSLANSGCLSETSQLSGGGWSWHKYGKAIDLGCWWYDDGDKADGDRAWNYVLTHAGDYGLQQMIWGDRIVDIRDGYKVRRYPGRDHYNHIHIAFSYAASQNWQIPTEDDLTPEQADTLNWIGLWLKDGGYPARSNGKVSRVEHIEAKVNAIELRVIALQEKMDE